MGTITKAPPDIYYTEDVKEALHQARYLSKKRKDFKPDEMILDRECLAGLLQSNRVFSRLDCLLNAMDVKPKALQKKLEECLTASEYSIDKGFPERSLIKRAEQLVLEENAESTAASQRLNVEHLLYALCQSEDSVVQTVFDNFSLTANTITQARESLLKKADHLPFSRLTLLSGLYLLRETVEIVFTVIVFLIIIKEGFGELRLIPSESMLPGLQIGDRLVVEKVTRWWRPYQREDILVFYPPPPRSVLHKDPFSLFMRATGFSSLLHNTSDDPVDKAYIKRVIGLPGETVEVVPGVGVYVNGLLLDEDDYTLETGYKCGMFCQPTKIPEGYYLMMGDNRNNSEDGRFFGFEPKERVVGRAFLRILPVQRIGLLD